MDTFKSEISPEKYVLVAILIEIFVQILNVLVPEDAIKNIL